ncbi:hypothetical protein KSP40_PGU013636 [Platanthera guangdongensis]|uniref:Uncharacterized protein n=1 Tax=Platanthera guangdongensis TaxID=2320717 RepID=A0ABR2MPN1_9ASPA
MAVGGGNDSKSFEGEMLPAMECNASFFSAVAGAINGKFFEPLDNVTTNWIVVRLAGMEFSIGRVAGKME